MRKQRLWANAFVACGYLFCNACLLLGQTYTNTFGFKQPLEEGRGPPRPTSSPSLILPPLLSDQSSYVGLGDDVGSAIALGDFTMDRFIDIVMAKDQKTMRSLYISRWHQKDYAFHPVQKTWNNSLFHDSISLDSIHQLPSLSFIAAAAPFDANADGILDILVSVNMGNGKFVGVVFEGNGMGGLRPMTQLDGIGPDLLIMDGNNDLIADILYTKPEGGFGFYKNEPPGTFTRLSWNPYERASLKTLKEDNETFAQASQGADYSHCKSIRGFNSNTFADMNGDCLPDLVITTEECGMHVWLNKAKAPIKAIKTQIVLAPGQDSFWDLSVENSGDRFVALNESIWSFEVGDGRPIFSDFNGDGTIDVAVPNSKHSRIRLSLNEQEDRRYGELCTADSSWSLHPYDALHEVRLADTALGPFISPGAIHVGDFNYDGLSDILIVNADSGIVELFEGEVLLQESEGFWKRLQKSASPSAWRHVQAQHHKVGFKRVFDDSVLSSMEDPLAAAFFDVDESGRQDVLVVQRHGTRLIWNSYNEVDDSEFFKATSNAVYDPPRLLESKMRSNIRSQTFTPMAGNTVKISYGGHLGHEQHICTQCPQTSSMSLQRCECLFGIRRIANYIEECVVGGGGVVHSWSSLMPNTMAIIWPIEKASGHWRVTYFTKSRGRQMFGAVVVLFSTLVVLAGVISYLHGHERVDERKAQMKLQYHFRG